MDEPPRPPYLPLMTTVESESEILPPPVQPPPRHRVWRSGDRIVAGVAGGLADVLGVAPLWTRLSFVVLACLEGVGVAAYLAGWLLLPSGPTAKTPSVARRVVGLLVLPVWLLAVSGGDWWGVLTGPAGLVLVLIGVAMALWSPRAASPVGGSAPPPMPVRVDEVASPVPPRQPPSPLGRVTFGIALVVAAAGTVIAQGSSTGIKVAFGLAVVVCAVGLLVGTLFGRARWLVVPAALFAAVSVAGAATENLGVSITGTRQDTSWGPGDEGPHTVEHRQGRWRHQPPARRHHRARGRRHPRRLRRGAHQRRRGCAPGSPRPGRPRFHRHAERLGGRLQARRDLRRWTVECAARPLRHRGRLRQHRDQPLRPFVAPARGA